MKKALLVGVGGLDFQEPPGTFIPGTDIFKLADDPEDFEIVRLERDGRFSSPPDLSQFDVVLNGLTVPDRAVGALEALATLTADYRGKLINHPLAIMETTRDTVSRKLSGIPGLIVPKVLRFTHLDGPRSRRIIGGSDITFPAILRLAGTHLGISMALVETPEDVLPILEKDKNYYLTSYRDYANEDGMYRKYRFFFIGNEIILRHVLSSDNWNVHAEARTRLMVNFPHLIQQERTTMLSQRPPLEVRFGAVLRKVKTAIGLDFFGMDCSITNDGKLLLFEANASMNLIDPSLDDPRFSHLQIFLKRARRAFGKMMRTNVCR